jgi:hypothetical protein
VSFRKFIQHVRYLCWLSHRYEVMCVQWTAGPHERQGRSAISTWLTFNLMIN